MAEEAKATAKAEGGGGKLVPALLVLNSVLLAGVLALLVLRAPGAAAKAPAHGEADAQAEAAAGGGHGDKAKDPKAALPGPTIRLGDFVVHLRDADADRYARVSFEMELADEKAKEVITARMPQIRDAFLAYLSDRTAEDLRGSEAMGRVKGALAARLGEVAPGSPVRALYVTELVVQ
jgi:flagellar FliL protein